MASWNVGPTEAPEGLPVELAASATAGVSVEIARATAWNRSRWPGLYQKTDSS